MAVVNIPNVGSVNFPDSMSQDDILSAIENDILPNYAGATANLGTMQMFVNGIADSSVFNSYTTNGGPCNAIGANWYPSSFNGKIDVVQIYNRALTAQEVKQNYQQYKTRFNLS